MNLIAAIEAFNKTSPAPIELQVTRDGRTVAKLPRVGREIVVKATRLNTKVKVTPQDVAALCEEARLSIAPGLALLQAGLAELRKVARAVEGS